MRTPSDTPPNLPDLPTLVGALHAKVEQLCAQQAANLAAIDALLADLRAANAK